MGFVVHREPITRNYYTTLCSCGFFFSVCLIALSAILPFVAAWTSQNFWIKHLTFREQPRVIFKKEMMMLLQLRDTDQPKAPLTLSWCTNEYGNEIMSTTTRIPSVKDYKLDLNGDGKADIIKISLSMPLRPTESVHHVWLIALFEYQLEATAKLDMEAAAIVDENTYFAGDALHVDGDLVFHQREVVSSFGGLRQPYINQPILDADEMASVSDFSPLSILRNYTARNFTTTYDYHSSRYWVPKPPLAVDQDGLTVPFDLYMTVRVPTQTILYQPGFGETVKYALMQYVTFYIILLPWMAGIRRFLFRHQILETAVVAEMPYGGQKLHAF